MERQKSNGFHNPATTGITTGFLRGGIKQGTLMQTGPGKDTGARLLPGSQMYKAGGSRRF
jgi:hypothetical protein